MGEQVPQFPARARANTGHRKAADKPRGAHTHPHARARTHTRVRAVSSHAGLPAARSGSFAFVYCLTPTPMSSLS